MFNSDPSYPRAQGAPYIVGVGMAPTGTVRYTDYNRFTFYTSMSQIWAATQGNERPFAGYYGPEARINLMIGVEKLSMSCSSLNSGGTGVRSAALSAPSRRVAQ